MKKSGCFLLCILLFIFALSGAGVLAEAAEADYAITLTAAATEVNAGQKVALTAAFANPEKVNQQAKNNQITWTVTDPAGNKTNAANINQQGVVTTQRNIKEKTVVVATAASKSMPGQTASVEITIVPLASKVKVQAETDIIYLQEGYNTVRLTAEIEPADAARGVTWKSSNEKVAKVDAEGVATAVSQGTANITATAEDGSNARASFKLTVGVPVGMLNSMSCSGNSSLIAGKGSLTFSVREFFDAGGNKINPTNKNISWSIETEPESAQEYITIDQKGILTATRECPPASVKVTATADGSLPAGTATYSMDNIFVIPASVAEPADTGTMDDFWGRWSVFMTADAKGTPAAASAWLSKFPLYSVSIEVMEYNGRPIIRLLLDYEEYNAWYVYQKDGALYTDDGSGEGGQKVLERCADGTAIQYLMYHRSLPDTRVFCVHTDTQKRITGTQEDSQSGSGMSMQDLQTTDIYGKTVNSSLLEDKKLVMVNIWATYCEPCINEMTDLGNISRDLADQGIMIVGIVCDCQNGDLNANEVQLKKARGIVESTGADYPHLLPSESMYWDFISQLEVVPTTFFVDGSGRQVGGVYRGARSGAEWEEIIFETLAELKSEGGNEGH